MLCPLLIPVERDVERGGLKAGRERRLRPKLNSTREAAGALSLEAERALIEAAQRDSSHFAEIYEHNFNHLYAFVVSRVHDRAEAEDITAETFHQALANLSTFEWRGVPFIAWLIRIAANAIVQRGKRAGREQTAAEVPEEPSADVIERRAMLFQMVDALPPDQKKVIVKRFVEERSIREIAQEMRRSEGAVKQLQFRALVNLRDRMEGAYE